MMERNQKGQTVSPRRKRKVIFLEVEQHLLLLLSDVVEIAGRSAHMLLSIPDYFTNDKSSQAKSGTLDVAFRVGVKSAQLVYICKQNSH